MKNVLLSMIVLLSFQVSAGEKMECFTRNIPAGFYCQGAVSPHDLAATLLPNAPNPAYIVRGCMANQGAPAPAEGFGLWSMGVDRNSEYYNASGYPATQNGPLDKVIQIGKLDLLQGQPRENCMQMDPPVKFTQGQDRIILNFDCAGSFHAYPTFQICWKEAE